MAPTLVESAGDPKRKRIKRAILQTVLGWALLLTLVFYSAFIHDSSQRAAKTDFFFFHQASVNLMEGRGIYDLVLPEEVPPPEPLPAEEPWEFLPNLNPPFQVLLFYPFAHLTVTNAYRIWNAIGVLCVLAGAILIGSARTEGRARATGGLALAVLALVYFPTCTALILGQMSLVPFLFLVLAWRAWRGGRLGTAGVILGTLGAVKLFFGAFLLFFVARREWRAAFAFVAAWFFFTAGSGAITGLESLVSYVAVLGTVDWFGHNWNASLLGFFTRVFEQPSDTALGYAPVLASLLGRGLSLLGILLLLRMARRRGSPERETEMNDLAFSACLVLMLLVSPLGWIYYFQVLLIPLVVIWEGSSTLPRGRAFRWLVVLAWMLSTVPSTQSRGTLSSGDPGISLGWAETYFFALVLFLGLIWVLQKRMAFEASPRSVPGPVSSSSD